jgi:pyruvate, water dikinase
VTVVAGPAHQPLDLADARDEQELGGKAVHLGEALRAGLPVPGGLALPAAFVEAVAAGAAAAVEVLVQRYAAIAVPVSVRSSGIGEDTEQTSFAGQHLTVLNVRTAEAVVDAVREVWRSAHSESAKMYRQLFGLEGEPRMGVVVQRLVEPDTAGVMFTRHPMTGADERVIDASWGLGEAVVGSLVAPDHFRLSRSGEVLERTPGRKDVALRILPGGGVAHDPVPEERVRALCLADEELRALHELATLCETVYGGEHDIEWAIQGGAVHLLQRRPLTAIG